MKVQLRVSDTALLLTIRSEPYVLYSKRGYQAAVDVENVHSGEEGYLIISAVSLSDQLHQLSQARNGLLNGASIMIKKAGKDRMAPYVVSVLD